MLQLKPSQHTTPASYPRNLCLKFSRRRRVIGQCKTAGKKRSEFDLIGLLAARFDREVFKTGAGNTASRATMVPSCICSWLPRVASSEVLL